MENGNLYLPNSIAANLPAMVRNELSRMSAQKQEEFAEEYKRKAKSTGTAFVLAFLGFFYAYKGQWGKQFLFWFTSGGMLIWWLIDLFRVNKLIEDENKDIATDIMRNLKAISG